MRPRLPLLGSAALRVTLGVAAGIILLSVGAMAVQYRITASALEDRQGELMAAELAGFAQFYEQRRIPGLREAIEARATVTGPDEALYLLQDRNGQRLAGNIASWPEGVVPSGSLFAAAPMVEVPGPAGAYRGVARELPGGFPLLAARAMTPVTETLRELRGTILRVAVEIMATSQLGAELSEQEVDDVVAFLGALTGELPQVTYPVLPAETAATPRPSGEVLPN